MPARVHAIEPRRGQGGGAADNAGEGTNAQQSGSDHIRPLAAVLTLWLEANQAIWLVGERKYTKESTRHNKFIEKRDYVGNKSACILSNGGLDLRGSTALTECHTPMGS